jgi:hypothetical protein
VTIFNRCIVAHPVLVSALFALVVLPAHADPGDCGPQSCRSAFWLSSTSDLRRYGVLIAAPDSGCRRVRYRVETEAAVFLGHTPPMRPGDLALVRMGPGFSPGEHALTLVAEGCAARPAAMRRVTLAKSSPDHGWRAAAENPQDLH